ncbi:IS element transposase [Burkholderia stagnalis]|nr:IS element transposase [Burkholderia stagnalis]
MPVRVPNPSLKARGLLTTHRHCHVGVGNDMKTTSLYRGRRFPAATIAQAVRWYFRFQLSLRDVEELLFERGVVVSCETIRR